MPGKRSVDILTKTSETCQTSQSLFGKLVKRSLRTVFPSCKLYFLCKSKEVYLPLILQKKDCTQAS